MWVICVREIYRLFGLSVVSTMFYENNILLFNVTLQPFNAWDFIVSLQQVGLGGFCMDIGHVPPSYHVSGGLEACARARAEFVA